MKMRLKEKVRYNVCFTKDGKEYVWKSHYKTYGGARRFISNFGWWRRFDGWYIERVKSWTDEHGLYNCSGVIIAQKKDTIAKNRFRIVA